LNKNGLFTILLIISVRFFSFTISNPVNARATEGMMKFATLVRGKDAADAMDLSGGEIALKQAMLNLVREVRNCPGFEEAHVVKMSHQQRYEPHDELQATTLLQKKLARA
jgi:hypothetical protein